MLDVVNYIEKNLEHSINPTNISKITSYSYFHFHRIFEMVVGETISSYQRTRRLAKATEKLLVSKVRIVDIAFSLQFESHEAFGRAFKKQYHVTPSAYRKNGVHTLIGQKFSLTENSIIGRSKLLHNPDIIVVKPLVLSGLYFPMSITNNESKENWLLFESETAKNETHLIEVPRYEIFETHLECDPTSLNGQSITTAFIGVEKSSLNMKHHNFESKQFSGGKYARFIHKGVVSTLIHTYQYIWGVWIPNNQIVLDARDDFECYTERFLGAEDENSEIDIFIPIK